MAQLQKNDLEDEDKIQNLNLKRSSVACIIYTSGTGGNPKGVILSHGGILNNLVGACEIMKPLIDSRPIFLTWLPLSHSYEHCVQFAQIAVGAKVFYAEKIEKLLDNISEAKPTIMTAVPRFYQNLYNKINKCVSILKIKPKIKRTMWSRRAQEYEQKINSGKIYELAEVVKDLNKTSNAIADQSYSERQLFEKAYDRLQSEFEIVLQISQADVKKKMDKALGRNQNLEEQ